MTKRTIQVDEQTYLVARQRAERAHREVDEYVNDLLSALLDSDGFEARWEQVGKQFEGLSEDQIDTLFESVRPPAEPRTGPAL